MTVQQSAADAVVKIRTPRASWMCLVGAGCFVLATGVLHLVLDLPRPAVPLALGCIFVAEALWIRTFGVDLTRESANLRGLRRQSIPWQQVQAVLRRDQFGSQVVTLVLESGQRLMLRAPTTLLGFGRAEYERDFHRIGQWWLAHRGESWRPVLPEAPRPPAQG